MLPTVTITSCEAKRAAVLRLPFRRPRSLPPTAADQPRSVGRNGRRRRARHRLRIKSWRNSEGLGSPRDRQRAALTFLISSISSGSAFSQVVTTP